MPPKVPYKQAMGALKKSLLTLEKERKRDMQMMRNDPAAMSLTRAISQQFLQPEFGSL